MTELFVVLSCRKASLLLSSLKLWFFAGAGRAGRWEVTCKGWYSGCLKKCSHDNEYVVNVEACLPFLPLTLLPYIILRSLSQSFFRSLTHTHHLHFSYMKDVGFGKVPQSGSLCAGLCSKTPRVRILLTAVSEKPLPPNILATAVSWCM